MFVDMTECASVERMTGASAAMSDVNAWSSSAPP
jgi:hypothetical protein